MSSTTGSIQKRGRTKSPFRESFALPLTLINNSAGFLYEGQEVVINGDNSVTNRTLGTQFPIGTVKIEGKAGETITVETIFNRDLVGTAKGGTLATGAFARPDGTVDADGMPNFVATAGGDFALAVVLNGGTVGTEIRLGMLRSPIKL